MRVIYAALIKAQSEMSTPVKNTINPFFGKTYADINSLLQAVLPALNSNGIGVIQPTCVHEGKNHVHTVLIHESGETIESFTEIIYSRVNDAQAQGSGISYARRYGLQALVCVGSEDDDGNKANQKPKENKEPELKPVDRSEEIKKIKTSKDLAPYWKSLSKIDQDFNQDRFTKMKEYLINKEKPKTNEQSGQQAAK